MTDRPLQQRDLDPSPSNPITLVRDALAKAGYIIAEYSRLARDLDVQEEGGGVYKASFFDDEQKPHRLRLKYNPDTQSMEIIEQKKAEITQDELKGSLVSLLSGTPDAIDETKSHMTFRSGFEGVNTISEAQALGPLNENELPYNVGYVTVSLQFVVINVAYNTESKTMRIVNEISRSKD